MVHCTYLPYTMPFPYLETRNWVSSKKSSGYLYPNDDEEPPPLRSTPWGAYRTRAAISWFPSQHNEPIWNAHILPIAIIHQVLILPTHDGWKAESTCQQWGSNSPPFAQESDVLLTELSWLYLSVITKFNDGTIIR